MVRSAAALLAALILPGYAIAQEVPEPTPPLALQEAPQGTHTVVDDDTLWDLAEHYLTDPWAWPRIWEANRDRVEDPDLIFPGWVLVIPGLPGERGEQGEVREIVVEETNVPVARRVDPATQRTVFYQDTAAFRQSVMALAEVEYPVVSRDGVYAAPWLIPLFTSVEDEGIGELVGPATTRSRVIAVRSYSRVLVTLDAPNVRVGDLLQTFRIRRTIPEVGQVVQPTGVLTVSELGAQGAIAVVTKEFARIQPGDYVRPVPEYDLADGRQPQPISGGTEAVIVGFASTAELHDVGQIAFLDTGSDDGVAVGDVFELFDREAGTGITLGALRVVGVWPTGAAARIVTMDGSVFFPEVVVQLTRSMR